MIRDWASFADNKGMTPESQLVEEFHNRRGCRRYPLELNLEVWPDASAAAGLSPQMEPPSPRRAVLDNLSLSGLYFYAARPYPMESLVWVRMRLGHHTYCAKGVVRRRGVRRISGQQFYGCGIQFVRCEQTVQFIAAMAGMLQQLPTPRSPAPPVMI